MGRMQVLGLGLVLVLSWAASSSGLNIKKTVGLWYHVLTASNKLEELRDENYLRFYSPYFDCINPKCDAISLGFLNSYFGYCRLLSTVIEKQHGGLYQTIVPPGNLLEVLDLGDSMLLLGYTYKSSSGNIYSVLALGRERMLSEKDKEMFQKVLQQKGINAEPVHFTGKDDCGPH